MEPNNNTTATPKSNTKTLLGVLLIVLILLAVIVFANRPSTSEENMQTENISEQAPVDQQIEEIRIQSDSDEVGSIEADLESTNIDNLEM